MCVYMYIYKYIYIYIYIYICTCIHKYQKRISPHTPREVKKKILREVTANRCIHTYTQRPYARYAAQRVEPFPFPIFPDARRPHTTKTPARSFAILKQKDGKKRIMVWDQNACAESTMKKNTKKPLWTSAATSHVNPKPKP